MKKCTKCLVIKPIDCFSKRKFHSQGLNPLCKECHCAVQSIWRRNNPDKVKVLDRKKYLKRRANGKQQISARKGTLREKYNVSLEWYLDAVQKQNNLCKICNKPESKKTNAGNIQALSVDHCHKTGKIRGIVCHRCNTLIGFAEKDIFGAVMAYLKESKNA